MFLLFTRITSLRPYENVTILRKGIVVNHCCIYTLGRSFLTEKKIRKRYKKKEKNEREGEKDR